MYFYFSSSFPAVLKINGIYYGSIFNTVKNCNIENFNETFIEVCPLSSKQSQISLLLSEEILCNPPENVLVTDLLGGFFISFSPTFISTEFKVVSQEKLSNCLVTLFNENGLKLSIDSKGDFYAESIFYAFERVEIKEHTFSNSNLLVIQLIGERTLLLVYSVGATVNKVFQREVDLVKLDEKLFTTEKYFDIAKHLVEKEWAFNGTEFTSINSKISCEPTFDKNLLHDRIIPFAFLEEFLLSGNYSEYLDQEILSNCQLLSEYFGEFTGVMPPPVFRSINEVGLVYQISERKYSVKYFSFECKNKKITNITKC